MIEEAYKSAKIANDDYTTYPVDEEGKVIAVDVIENGKTLKFINKANALPRMIKQIADNEGISIKEAEEFVYNGTMSFPTTPKFSPSIAATSSVNVEIVATAEVPVAVGSDVTYQWYVSGDDGFEAIEGATTASYTPETEGTYKVVASCEKNGKTKTNSVIITVA